MQIVRACVRARLRIRIYLKHSTFIDNLIEKKKGLALEMTST